MNLNFGTLEPMGGVRREDNIILNQTSYDYFELYSFYYLKHKFENYMNHNVVNNVKHTFEKLEPLI